MSLRSSFHVKPLILKNTGCWFLNSGVLQWENVYLYEIGLEENNDNSTIEQGFFSNLNLCRF